MPGPQLTGKHLLSGLCCGPDMSGPYRVTMANGSCGGVKTPPYRSGVHGCFVGNGLDRSGNVCRYCMVKHY